MTFCELTPLPPRDVYGTPGADSFFAGGDAPPPPPGGGAYYDDAPPPPGGGAYYDDAPPPPSGGGAYYDDAPPPPPSQMNQKKVQRAQKKAEKAARTPRRQPAGVDNADSALATLSALQLTYEETPWVVTKRQGLAFYTSACRIYNGVLAVV